MSKAGAAAQVKLRGNRERRRAQKTAELPQAPPPRAKGGQSRPCKDRAISSRWPGNAMSKRSSGSSHSAARKCRARMRLIAHGMAAAPALLVIAEAPVYRVPNNRPGKARHPAGNAERALREAAAAAGDFKYTKLFDWSLAIGLPQPYLVDGCSIIY
jgi:hypothetical protein